MMPGEKYSVDAKLAPDGRHDVIGPAIYTLDE